MPEPTCTIEWTYEGYRAVWLYDGTNSTREEFAPLCVEVAKLTDSAETVEELTTAVESWASARGLHVRMYPGPSAHDPGRNTFRVTLFKEPRVEWS